ncbi:hypothetical protein CAPN001_02240 [Capnocytophaga stomatis]|nr:hypothetical protein CAPN001_02240 [Capnocytophaga stomatis]
MNVVKETVFINGEEFVFDSLTLTQELNDCQSFELIQKITSEKELWLKSPQKLTEMIGDSVLIRFEYGKEAYRYEFSGYITEVLIDSAWQGSRDNVIRFIGQGKVVVLEDTPSMYSFVDQHLVNIVKTIAQEKEFGIKCRPRFEGVLPFVMQYKESSFAFLNRLSALYNELFFYDGKNIVFGCPENETPEKLIFREDINQLKTISKALPYRYSLYNYSSQDDEYFFTQTDKPISPENAVTQTLLTQVPLFANRGILPAQEPVGYNADTQVFRQGKYQRALGKMHFIEGHSDTCKVRIGGLIQVGYPSEFGIDNSLGVYRVISVHHKVERGSYSNIFRAVPEGMEYAMFEPKTVAYPEIAEVVENNDPQGQGRVKVRFYWQRDKGAETNWIRVQSSDAGVLRDKSGNRGVVFIPEVGDQVMIGFEYGNPHQPFVMGSMFHKTNASEVSNNVRSITTKSGHKLVFTDDESIVLSDKNGNMIQINSVENTIEITAIEQLNFKSKKITFEATDDMEFFAGGNKKETVMKDSEFISDKITLNAHTKTEVHSGEKTSVVSKEINLFTSESDIRVKAGNTTYIQGGQGVEIDS